MKRLMLSTTLCLLAFIGLQAQLVIDTNTKWWDGSVLYNVKMRMGNMVYLEGQDAQGDVYKAVLERNAAKAGDYFVRPVHDEALAPWRAQYGWHVQYVRHNGMDFLTVLNQNNACCYTLLKTVDNLETLTKQEEWAESQPVSSLLQHMLLNTTYLGRFSMDELRLMRNEILARHGWKFQSSDLQAYFSSKSWYKAGNDNNAVKLSVIENVNIQLIKSEETVPEVQRSHWMSSESQRELRSMVEGGSFPGGLDDDGRGPDEVGDLEFTVRTEEEFLAALGSNRTIVIAENVHLNLSRVLERADCFQQIAGRRWAYGTSSYIGQGPLVVSEPETDGRQMVLANMSQLTIRGASHSSIEIDPRYSFCLYFINCDHCELYNLTIGHTEGGFCSGGVIGVKGGRQNMVKNCDLYGCGTYGFDLRNTTDFGVFDSKIHDCTYGIMMLNGNTGVSFSKCDFFSNKQYDLVESHNSQGVTFTDCRFYANNGDSRLFNFDTTFYLMGSEIYHPTENVGTIDKAEHLQTPSKFYPNPLDKRIKGRKIGPDIE